jgi:hypothetical protein
MKPVQNMRVLVEEKVLEEKGRVFFFLIGKEIGCQNDFQLLDVREPGMG